MFTKFIVDAFINNNSKEFQYKNKKNYNLIKA